MKLSAIALTFLSVASATANPFAAVSKNNAKSAYMSKLLRAAKETKNSQLRRLDQNADFEIDIASYELKFHQCQFVKTWSDELAEKGDDYDTVLETQRFAIFRLCPSGTCSSCTSAFGEYLIDLDSYLQATVQYFQEVQENMCQACEENCQNDGQNNEQDANAEDGGRRLDVDCSTCVDECDKIENMEQNGYIDATEFLECQMVYDPEDDSIAALYAGPMCASSGTKIKIGIFLDEFCAIHDDSKDVENYLVDGDGYAMKLSHALLKNTYATDSCISCTEVNENENDNADGDQVAEVCEQLYEEAAKCEATNGFESGYAKYNGYENQLAQEEIICDYIKSLESGTYDESGEIVLGGSSSRSASSSSTTGGQKFALSFFIIGTVGLAAYAAVLHSKLTKGGKADLSRPGGAMA